MRRRPLLFLFGILAAILADYVIEQALLVVGASSRTAWIAGAVSFALVWGVSLWITLHLPPRPNPGGPDRT